MQLTRAGDVRRTAGDGPLPHPRPAPHPIGRRVPSHRPTAALPAGAPVLVVDDHAFIAESVELLLRGAGVPVLRVLPESTAEVLAAGREHAPAVVLLDLGLGTAADGSAVHGLHLVSPLVAAGCRVVVFTAEASGAAWGAALEQGATTVLSKSTQLGRLLEVVQLVRRGGDPLGPDTRQVLLAAARAARSETEQRLARFGRLTPREAEVLQQIAGGASAASIARDGYVSEATVRTQIRAVLTKLEVTSQLQAVAAAWRTGWLGPPGPDLPGRGPARSRCTAAAPVAPAARAG